MELLFAYIGQSLCLESIELNFSPYYKISFNSESNQLSISKNSDVPRDFFPDAISSISVIVGNNGVGKSTAIKWILQAIVEGSREKDPDGIIVYKRSDNYMIVYLGERYAHTNIISNSKQSIKVIYDLWNSFDTKIACTYYSGHFSPYSAWNTFDRELAGQVNISDTWMILKDLQSYENRDIDSLTNPVGDHLYAFEVQNTFRIAQMLMDDTLRRELATMIRLPRFIVFNPNNSGKTRLRKDNRIDNDIKNLLFKHENKYENLREDALDCYIEDGLLNYVADQSDMTVDMLEIPLLWLGFPRTSDGPIADFHRFLNSSANGTYLPHNLFNLIKLLYEDCSFQEMVKDGFFYCEVAKSGKLIDRLTEILFEPSMISARFFDMSYAIKLKNRVVLSSGEAQMLNLLSRIYWHIAIESRKFANLDVTPMIILDEAEIGFHPQWQQRYISLLIFFFSRMADFIERRDKKRVKFQIIYTTHSPISLSDMPKACVNFLKLEKGRTRILSEKEKPQTFGANVFELYADSFFMEQGLIGEFAAEKIKALSSEIDGLVKKSEQDNNLNQDDDLVFVGLQKMKELRDKINLIGDKRIKTYLHSRLDIIDPSDEIRRLKRRIAELEAERDNRHEEN